jgi:uncharacterized damage-inducible protein DinB
MIDAVLPYRAMACSNACANYACSRLAPNEFTAKRTGFFSSLRATLNHILVMNRFYVDAMEGGTLGPATWADPEPFGTVRRSRKHKEGRSALDRRGEELGRS